MVKKKAKVVATLATTFALRAQAFQIASVSPQGEVTRVRLVVAKFDDSAVNYGDPKTPASLALSCSDAQATKGSGRWIRDREWAFEFKNELPPSINCTLQACSGMKSAYGPHFAGVDSYKFNSGGSFIKSLRPGSYERIDEEQYFLRQLIGPATLKSVQDNVWCFVEGLGERMQAKLVASAERDGLLRSQGLEKAAAKDPLNFVTLACNRRPKSSWCKQGRQHSQRCSQFGGEALRLPGSQPVLSELQL